jgi:dynein heavy chain
MNPVGPRDYNMIKAVTPFIQDSYDDHTSRKLQGPLLKQLIDFSDNEKDNINEETIELLEPYLTVKTPPKDGKDGEKLFTPENAAKASAALRGLCTWA